MSARLLLMMLLLAVPLAGQPAEQTPKLMDVAKALRDGKLDVGKEYSIYAKTGRYHNIHVDVIGLDCDSCHSGSTYKDDLLLVGKDEPYVKRSKGRYDRTGCLGCHRKGGEGSRFYGNTAMVK